LKARELQKIYTSLSDLPKSQKFLILLEQVASGITTQSNSATTKALPTPLLPTVTNTT